MTNVAIGTRAVPANTAAIPTTAKADGAAWTDPNVVLSIIGIVVSMGMAYQMLQDVKARMLVLEQQAASKETAAAVTATARRATGRIGFFPRGLSLR